MHCRLKHVCVCYNVWKISTAFIYTLVSINSMASKLIAWLVYILEWHFVVLWIPAECQMYNWQGAQDINPEGRRCYSYSSHWKQENRQQLLTTIGYYQLISNHLNIQSLWQCNIVVSLKLTAHFVPGEQCKNLQRNNKVCIELCNCLRWVTCCILLTFVVCQQNNQVPRIEEPTIERYDHDGSEIQ